MKVAILGASDRPDRYAYKAMKLLEAKGHQSFLINPKIKEVEGRPVFSSLSAIPEDIHTLAMYVNPKISSQEQVKSDILKLAPKRVIFNPGSENRELYPELQKSNIKPQEACTLVLLNTGQF